MALLVMIDGDSNWCFITAPVRLARHGLYISLSERDGTDLWSGYWHGPKGKLSGDLSGERYAVERQELIGYVLMSKESINSSAT